MLRIRNGWFSAKDAPADLVEAVRIGGRVACTSALARRGIWTMPDDRLHVSLSADSSRVRQLTPNLPTVVHWRHFTERHTNSSLDSVSDSIAHLIGCGGQETAIVSIDSALNKRLLSASQLVEILSWLPTKYATIADLVDARSQSGLETLARLRLRRLGLHVRIQVTVRGVGTVDVLIGDRLILELDSREHHLGAGYEKDRTRDLHATDRGYLPLRVSYRRVMYDWQSVEDVVLRLVRRGEHVWTESRRQASKLAENSGKTAVA